MRLVKSHFVIFFALLVSNCASALPSQPPQDLTIYFSRGGGMSPANDSLTIRKGQLTYSDNYIDAKAGFTVPITEQEVAALYQVLRDNKFDRIKLLNEFVNDKGGENITLSWPGNNYSMGTSGEVVSPSWQKEWENIIVGFDALIKTKSAANQVSIKVVFDKSLAGRYVSFYLNQTQGYAVTVSQTGLEHTFDLLPGTYQMDVQAIRDYNPKVYMSWEEVQKRMQESHQLLKTTTKTLTISLVGEQLSVVAE